MLRCAALFALIVLTGCLQLASSACDDGSICPSGFRCARADDKPICVPPTCGNGRLDLGEVCDDGNNVSGDGCPADCGPACGDGIRDPGEACDDGNTVGGDGCSADCHSSELCGNGILDPGEACDDGDLQNHDGCSSRCLIEQSAWSAIGAGPDILRAVAAYDAARGVTVLVQNDVNAPSVRTWEWDGVAWRARSSATVPPVMGESSLLYDAAHQRVLEVGISQGGWTVWAWDGIDWAQQPSGAGPPALLSYALAYDVIRKKVVLFGGGLSFAGGLTEWQNGTWEWGGASWREITTPTAAPPRGGHAMAYDARRGVIVMYGGESDGLLSNDVWEYDGVDWTSHSDASAPPNPFAGAMTFDAARGAVVIFGGIGASSDLWEWDGAHWAVRNSSAEPPPRFSPAMTYDIARSKVLLFGGVMDELESGFLGALNDTWEWDGNAWANRAIRTLGRQSGGMIYDPLLGKIVMFGGDQLDEALPVAGTGLLNDTWDWDGVNWVPVPLPSSFPMDPTTPSPPLPTARMAFAMATDGRETVLFGGFGADGVALADTWILFGTTWSLAFVGTPFQLTPLPRSQHAMTYDAARNQMVLFGGAPQRGQALDDTWVLAGSWVRASPMHTPTQRQSHAMAYDGVRQVVVMFGGQSGAGLLADTWTWNGTDWTALTPPAAPPARRGHAVAFDTARGKLVLFGGASSTGLLADTWEWDGTTWLQRAPATVPPARNAHMMAYDPNRGRVVMFGGVDSSHALDDVWEWDGINWQRVKYASSPPARSHQAMTYDDTRTTTLMFGGLSHDGTRRLNDTWLWNDSGWRDFEPTVAPPARAEHAMAFDSARAKAVLFGGTDANPNAPDGVTWFADTWEWDGTSWVEQHPLTRPPARRGHAMVYDAARGRTLLFGGNQAGSLLADQWTWDGTRWTDVTPAIAPPRRTDFALAYDQERQRVVLFGGRSDSGRLGDVWEWDGSTWLNRTPATVYVPTARSGATMVYDAARRRVVVFGGQSDTASLNDSWDWDGTTWAPLSPTPLPSPRHHQAMAYDAARGDLLMFGGDDGSVLGLSDTWLLRYEDQTMSSETCQAGVDSDGDGKAGCDDPDCAGFCTRCGDGVCDPAETCGLCPADCGSCTVCGDFQCDSGESCASCPGDCGLCPPADGPSPPDLLTLTGLIVVENRAG
jgi:cysteine-rich repeat protein